MLKKILKISIFIIAVLSVFSFFAIKPYTTKADSPPYGDGDQDFPYQISSCSDLQNIPSNAGGYYILTANIDCSDSINWNSGEGFIPISGFSGNFNGEGYSITGIYINASQETGLSDLGLFETNGGTIDNVSLVSETIVSSDSDNATVIGGLVGGSTSSNALSNDNVSGTITQENCNDADNVDNASIGLLAGYSTDVAANDSATGTIDDNTGSCGVNTIGGLIGNNGEISNSYADVDISSNSDGAIIGGLGGSSSASEASSYSSGSITATGTGQTVGGLIGVQNSAYIVTDNFTVTALGGADVCNYICGAIAGVSNGVDLSTDYFDQTAVGISACDGDANSSCSSNNINVGGAQPDYFDNNLSSPPLNTWDFINTWSTSSGLPVLNAYVDPSPSPVTGVTLSSAASNGLSLSWDTPSSAGSSSISDYLIIYEVANSDDWQTIDTNSTNTSYSTISSLSLPANTQYTIEIVAENSDDSYSLGSQPLSASTLIPGYHSITTCQQLQDIENNLSDNYELAGNIDCSDSVNWNGGEGFMPIGQASSNSAFSGELEGNNYSIDNLYITSSLESDEFAGLFAYTAGATIQDVKFVNPEVDAGASTAAVGIVTAWDDGGTTINNVQVDNMDIANAETYAGGLIGVAFGPDIVTQSSVTGSISSAADNTFGIYGGLAGALTDQISNSLTNSYQLTNDYANTTINLTVGQYVTGGLVAYGADQNDQENVSNSYAAGSINVSDDATSVIGGFSGVGNLQNIYNSFSAVNINDPNTSQDTIGGFIGQDIVGTDSYSNDYYDATLANTSQCSGSDTISGCAAVNSGNSVPTYFDDNSTNPPLNDWDFTNTWDTTTGLPIFKADATPNPISPSIVTVDTSKQPSVSVFKIPTPKSSVPASKTTTSPTTVTKTTKPRAIVVPSTSTTKPAAPTSIISKAVHSITNIISHAPKIVLVSFPYVLFGCLLLFAILVTVEIFWQNHKARIIMALITKQKNVAEERDTFWHLTANYLRSPITLLIGGTEVLKDKEPDAPYALKLYDLAKSLQASMSQIMKEIESSYTLKKISWPKNSPIKTVLIQARFWGPLGVVGLLVFIVEYLSRNYRHIRPSLLSYATQVVIFVIIAYVLYRALTILSFSKRRRKDSEHLLDEQNQYLDKARVDLIFKTNSQIGDNLTEIEGLLTKLPTRDKDYLPMLNEGVRRLREIIDDFQLLGVLQNDKLEDEYFVNGISNAFSVVNNCLQDFKSDLDSKHLDVVLPADENIELSGRQDLVTQVIRSLLRNAIDFSPSYGQVRVGITQSQKYISLSISDQGQGITKDQLSHLFRPFTRTDGSDALQLNHQGIGINLYIDKLIMDKIGGSIKAESKLNHGTTITVSWPVPKETLSKVFAPHRATG